MSYSTFNFVNHEKNTDNIIKNLNTVIDDQHIQIKKLNKQILKIKCDDDEIIKNLDDKLFVLRAELRKIQGEKQELLDRIIQLEATPEISTS
jgi:hypothetical protein